MTNGCGVRSLNILATICGTKKKEKKKEIVVIGYPGSRYPRCTTTEAHELSMALAMAMPGNKNLPIDNASIQSNNIMNLRVDNDKRKKEKEGLREGERVLFVF